MRIQKKLKVLVVDDDIELLEMIKEAFEETDFSLITARDGSEAIAKVRNDKFDVILTDIKMPKRDGLSFVKDLRDNERIAGGPKNAPKTPVVVISASVDEYKDFFASYDPIYMLAKPFSPEKLVALSKVLVKKTI